jgi:hydroxymethylglutaryl-CoA reductase (NADPH)
MSELTGLSDDELVTRVCSGELPPHSLEDKLGDCERAVRVRREWVERENQFDASTLPYKGFDYASVLGACAEMVIGYVPLPVGVAGPLLMNGSSFQVISARSKDANPRFQKSQCRVCLCAPCGQVPMATVEGTLIASTRRGCKAITESGGASAAVLQHAMTRAPVLLFPSAMRAAAFKKWVEVCSLHFPFWPGTIPLDRQLMPMCAKGPRASASCVCRSPLISSFSRRAAVSSLRVPSVCCLPRF